MNQWDMDVALWPEIRFPDIYMYSMYLILTPGKYTKPSLKAYRSLGIWLYFKMGFVGEIKVMRTVCKKKDLLNLFVQSINSS